MKRLTDVQYWEEHCWMGERPRRLKLYRDIDYETVRLIRQAGRAVVPTIGARLRVLEIGAGGSRVLPYLARKFGYEVFGSDFSMAGCGLLRANLALQKVEGGVVCEDMFLSSLPAGSFDVVYSSGLVEHFDDTRVALAEHLRLVRPGGRLVVIVPNLQGLHGGICRRLALPLYQRHRVFAPADLAGYFKDLGVTDISAGYLGSFLIAVGRGAEWPAVARWPAAIQWLLHNSVRIGNGMISLFFRLLPVRPHTRALSPAFFAIGTKPHR